MKKKLPIILLGVILACVLVFGFLYANNDIGKTANSLEADIRQSQKILDDWISGRIFHLGTKFLNFIHCVFYVLKILGFRAIFIKRI